MWGGGGGRGGSSHSFKYGLFAVPEIIFKNIAK